MAAVIFILNRAISWQRCLPNYILKTTFPHTPPPFFFIEREREREGVGVIVFNTRPKHFVPPSFYLSSCTTLLLNNFLPYCLSDPSFLKWCIQAQKIVARGIKTLFLQICKGVQRTSQDAHNICVIISTVLESQCRKFQLQFWCPWFPCVQRISSPALSTQLMLLHALKFAFTNALQVLFLSLKCPIQVKIIQMLVMHLHIPCNPFLLPYFLYFDYQV